MPKLVVGMNEKKCLSSLKKEEKRVDLDKFLKVCNLDCVVMEPEPASHYLSSDKLWSTIYYLLLTGGYNEVTIPYGFIVTGIQYVGGSKMNYTVTNNILSLGYVSVKLSGVMRENMRISKCNILDKPKCQPLPMFLYSPERLIKYIVAYDKKGCAEKTKIVLTKLNNVLASQD